MRLWKKWTRVKMTSSIIPVAVLTSDVHYDIKTLELADVAMRQAIAKANSLDVPLIIAGDLHESKANLRGECVNAMLTTFSQAQTAVYILIGNHDKINEKSEDHSLNFLARDRGLGVSPIYIIDEPFYSSCWTLIPYQHVPEQIPLALEKAHPDSVLIMHQGIHGSLSGEYIQDKTAIPKDWLKDFRVISGHYHTRQTIKTGRPKKGCKGLFDYIGNPFSLSFGEANDPDKGFQILMSDGSLEFVPTNLRKHVVINIGPTIADSIPSFNQDDLIKVKITDTKEELSKVTKAGVRDMLGLPESYKLELIPLSTQDETKQNKAVQNNNLDDIIEVLTNTTAEQKERLKILWKELCE